MNGFIASNHHEKLSRARATAQPAGWRRTVKVWALPGTSEDPIDWHIESSLKDPHTGDLVFNKTNDHMPKSDYYLIDFILQDATDLALRFQPNPMDAFWVIIGDSKPQPCPEEKAYCDQVYAICDDPDGKRLTVRNDDMEKQHFQFSLGFVSDANGKKYRYDPGGDNDNGNYNYTQYD